MSASDTEQVVRMLEAAQIAALAGGMVGVSIVLTDQDGKHWPSRYEPKLDAQTPRLLGPVARVQ